jgi:hypothetical protein
MNQIVPISSPALPALIANAGEHAAICFSNSSRPISRNPQRAESMLEKTPRWANHASTRTTQLYDRRATGALRSAVYQLAALTIGARLAVADG